MESGTIGERIAELRARRGWTQAQLAVELELSHSYVSLLEAGKRTPRERVLHQIAERLSCSVDYLLTGRGGAIVDTLDLDLRFAELALRSGDAAAARDRFAAAMQRATRLGNAYRDERLQALWGLSRAHETLDELDVALRGFEQLNQERTLPAALSRTAVLKMLCRTYMGCGDLNRAIEIGEAALREAGGSPERLRDDDVIELASTLVCCYYERGDLTTGTLLAESVLAAAEAGGSLRARASAAWNAAVLAEARGDMATAFRLTERALALFGEVGNAWAIAVLQVNTAWLHLRMPQPDTKRAAALLEGALADLPQVGRPTDIATAESELARCALLDGDPARAVELGRSAVARLSDGPRLDGARARVVLADALLAVGDPSAVDEYLRAATELEQAGASRQAAQAWCQLADAFVSLGLMTEALSAYRHVAESAGLATRSPVPTGELVRRGERHPLG
ncbi:MAG: helix-turn-helix domain-containing protein [Frankiaceae bacterium]